MSSKNPLEEYFKKRDFSKTPEPRPGTRKPGESPIFVIQKHDWKWTGCSNHGQFPKDHPQIRVRGVLQ